MLGVTVNGQPIGVTTSYTIDKIQRPYQITVYFGASQYNINASASGNGKISIPGDKNYLYGSNATYTMTPDAGHHITDVVVDGVSVGAVKTYTFTSVDMPHTIRAAFAPNPTYIITASVTGSGSITPAGITAVLAGLHQQYTITPDAGFLIGSVMVNGINKGVQTSWTFNAVSANQTLEVNFIADTFNLTASAGSYGSINPAGVTTLARGNDQTYTFTPDANYQVQNVIVNGGSKGALENYSFTTVQANQTISVTFTKVSYNVTASVTTAGGSISPVGTKAHIHGTSPIYYITPAPGYKVTDVIVDNKSVGAVTRYTFTRY